MGTTAFHRNKRLWGGLGVAFVGLMVGKQAIWNFVRGEVTKAQNTEQHRASMEAELSKLNHKHRRIEAHLRVTDGGADSKKEAS